MAVDPLWKRAPLLLLTSHVGAGLAVAAAVLVLTVASASSRLLVSSAGSAAFTRLQQTALTRADGVVATGEGPATAEGIFGVDALLRRELGDLPGLARPTMSLAGMQFQRTPDATGVEGADGSVITATLFHRDELLPFVQAQPGSEGSGDGLWLPDTVADQARLGPGDEATLASVTAADGEPVTVSVPIDGIYRDPFDDGLLPADAADTWMDVRDRVPRDEESTRVPPLLLAGRDAFIEHTRALGDRVSATWNVPLADPSMSLAHAEALSADLDGFFARAGDPTGATVATISEFARPGEFDADTTLPASVEQANAVAATLTPPLGSLALAAQAVALVLVGAAVAMLLRRRHHELRLLGAQGASPLDTGLRVALEICPPPPSAPSPVGCSPHR